jgi:HSP20 family protein
MKPYKQLTTLGPDAWMRRVFRDFDPFFEEPPLSFLWRHPREYNECPWTPELEVFERDHRLIVRLDLPGLAKEDLAIEVVGGVLTITGERRRETQEEKESWYGTERTYGRFYRAVPLPEHVNPAEINATFINGVLELTIPVPVKTAAQATYKVPIEETKEKSVKAAA